MKQIITFLSIIVFFACTSPTTPYGDTTQPEQTIHRPGQFSLSQLDGLGRVAVDTNITTFDLGDIKASREFYILI